MAIKVSARLGSKQHVSSDKDQWSLNFIVNDGSGATITLFVSTEDADKYEVDSNYNVTVTEAKGT